MKKAKAEPMSYEKLVKLVENRKPRMTKWDVTCFLIGYQGVVAEADWENIMRLYDDGIVD